MVGVGALVAAFVLSLRLAGAPAAAMARQERPLAVSARAVQGQAGALIVSSAALTVFGFLAIAAYGAALMWLPDTGRTMDLVFAGGGLAHAYALMARMGPSAGLVRRRLMDDNQAAGEMAST